MGTEEDTSEQVGVRILDRVLGEIRECNLKGKESCGYPVVGIVSPSPGRTRFIPLNLEAFRKTMEELSKVEGGFWGKRTDVKALLKELDDLFGGERE